MAICEVFGFDYSQGANTAFQSCVFMCVRVRGHALRFSIKCLTGDLCHPDRAFYLNSNFF